MPPLVHFVTIKPLFRNEQAVFIMTHIRRKDDQGSPGASVDRAPGLVSDRDDAQGQDSHSGRNDLSRAASLS